MHGSFLLGSLSVFCDVMELVGVKRAWSKAHLCYSEAFVFCDWSGLLLAQKEYKSVQGRWLSWTPEDTFSCSYVLQRQMWVRKKCWIVNEFCLQNLVWEGMVSTEHLTYVNKPLTALVSGIIWLCRKFQLILDPSCLFLSGQPQSCWIYTLIIWNDLLFSMWWSRRESRSSESVVSTKGLSSLLPF